MYIKKLTVNNFRIFGESGVDVIFNKGVNAIIGENNSGKSALIDAIRIAFTAVQYRKDIYFSKADFHVNARGERATSAQFDIYLEGVPQTLIDIWNPECPTAGEFHIKFYIDTRPSGEERIKYHAWGGKVEGNSLSSDTFDAINLAYLGALRNAESELKPSRSSRLATLLSTITTSDENKMELVNELENANKLILESEPIKRTKEIINNNLLNIEQELLRQQIDIGLVEPRFESITASLRSWIVPRWYFLNEDFDHYDKICEDCSGEHSSFINPSTGGSYLDITSYLNSGIEIDDQIETDLLSFMKHSFELHQNGLGYNNILFMSAVLGDMVLDKAGVYLNIFAIEEPEAHLHPQLQELIHSFFEKKHDDSSNMQVIYTSHSPTLVSRIGINSINLLYDNNYDINCYPLSMANLEDVDKDYLEKYLDITKSQMFFAKGIIFVEGISEAILVPEFAKILNRSFDKYSVELVNVNGTSFKPFAKILTVPEHVNCFAKAAIITDDDRCTDTSSHDTYISRELDYNDDISDIESKLSRGSTSERYDNIEVCGAVKTFEYELALESDNIPYILDAIKEIFPTAGLDLATTINCENNPRLKAIMIWLFMRKRDKSKAQVAQSLYRIIKKQRQDAESGVPADSPFIVPEYISNAIFSITE